MTKLNDFINNWKDSYTERILQESESKKKGFNFKDAIHNKYSELRTSLDCIMIDYIAFMESKPLQQNDYFKYVNAYNRTGKKLNPKYFRHDIKKLKSYYDKVDNSKACGDKYYAFNENVYRKYVLYMMLKLKGQYIPNEHDDVFNVKINGHREFNPSTNISSVLRGSLPFEIKEFDISRAYPTFIFLQLGMKPFDVYERFDKVEYNKLLNTHSEITSETIYKIRGKLEPIYGKRAIEVITEDRFNNPGRLYEELTKMEKHYIERMVTANDLTNYVRLHDGIITLSDVECDTLIFDDIVEFKVKDYSLETLEIPDKIFYSFNDHGEPFTTPMMYRNFFEQEGFIKIKRENYDSLVIIKNTNKVVKPINHNTNIGDYLIGEINEGLTKNIEKIANLVADDTVSKINKAFKIMKGVNLEYHRDTASSSYFPHKNGVVKVTKQNMELIDYKEIEGFFSEVNTLNHAIKIKEDKSFLQSPFVKFLAMAIIGRETDLLDLDKSETQQFLAFCSMIGYMLSNHKNGAKAFMIMLTDHNADGVTRKGRRGKSLLQLFFTFFRASLNKGDGEYDPTYRHVHADLEKFIDVYILDDMPANFPYTSMYTPITGTIKKEGKGFAAEQIEFKDTPKFCGSTNFKLRYDKDADSTNDRIKEYKFTDYWNINNKPSDYFGKSFFGEGEDGNKWDWDEWNDLYNFGFYCVQYFLKNGLETIEYDKTIDNFGAYFYDDSVLEEMTRILRNMKNQSSFTVTDFITVHKQSDIFRYKPEFSSRNAKKRIDAYIEYKKLPFKYSQRTRKWIKHE